MPQITVAIVLLPAEEMEIETRGSANRQLSPAANAPHCFGPPAIHCVALQESIAQRRDVLSRVESSGEFHAADWIQEPVEREEAGIDLAARHVCDAPVEPRCDLDLPLIVQVMEKLVAAFKTRPGGFERSGEGAAGVGNALAGLHNAHLRSHPGAASEMEILLYTGLRKPEPKIPCAGQG